ncbi:ABC transporter permease, partial [Psychrobacter sp. 1Y1]|uniref:ABC transporter permease n=1 Tax=Psychrobacter sp. 1Y1 TaxID=3453574 RepID=UPI003F483C05
MVLGLAKGWSVASYTLALLIVMPLIALIGQSFLPDGSVFTHLFDTVLPTYISNSLWLMFWVVIGSLIIAVPAAWLVAKCHFPGRRIFQWALLLPLAMPAYVVAYVYTDLFNYAGPVQRGLRTFFGWQTPQDYY